jgi:ABC-type sugar transport system ATPase subunit
MGDNNVLRGRVVERSGDRLVIEQDEIRTSVAASGEAPAVGEEATVAIRAAAVEVDDGASPAGDNSTECEIVFVEFLGDLVKLHLATSSERMLAKVPGERYPTLRGREGERIRISWKEEDVQLLRG